MSDDPSAPQVPPPLLPPLAPPPPVPPPPLVPAPPPSPSRRGPLLAVIALLVIAGLGAALLLAQGGDETDADATLAAVQAAVGDASSFRFTMSGEDTFTEGDSEAGTETTMRFTGEGAWSDGRWRSTFDSGFDVSESIFDGSTSYDRWAPDAESLADELWVTYDLPPMSPEDLVSDFAVTMDGGGYYEGEVPDLEGIDDSMAVGLAGALFFGGVGMGNGMAFEGGGGMAVDPAAFLDGIQQLSDPTAETGGGTTTLVVTVSAPAELVESFGNPIPDTHVELDVGPDDLPTALRADAAQGLSSFHVEIELSEWNTPIEIALPGADQIDATPWLDEEALRSLTEFQVVWPASPPAGWEMSVYSYEEEFAEELASGCEQIDMSWDAPVADDASDDELVEAGYLYLTERSVACALEEDPTPFEPGGPGGLPSRSSGFGAPEVQVGDTAVVVNDSSLSDTELAAVLASLTPVDVETVISAATPSP